MDTEDLVDTVSKEVWCIYSTLLLLERKGRVIELCPTIAIPYPH